MDLHAPHPRRRTAPAARALALAALVAAGCSTPGPLTSRYTMIGALKTNLAQVEAERDGLRREVADLKTQNRRINDQLVRSESANGDLIARLNDARHLIKSQGGDPDAIRTQVGENDIPPPRTAPAGRSNRKGRRSPLTQIPGLATPAEPDDEEFEAPTEPPARDDRQSRLDDGSPWQPMARGRGNDAPR